MTSVKIEMAIPAPIDKVWDTVVEVEQYQKSMTHIRSVNIIDQPEEGLRRVAWSVLLKGAILEWVEEEILDPKARTIQFKQLSGDLQQFEGRWVLQAERDAATIVLFEVDFEIGIPSLAEILNPVAQRSLRENCVSMLRGIETQAAIG